MAFYKGWHNQLKDEPVLNIFYGRKWKLVQSGIGSGFGYDLIPHVGGALGNVATLANAGAQVRFGWNLPNDFGTFLIRPGSDSNAPLDKQDPRFFPRYHRIGIHLFVAVDGHAVLRNIFLDGNTFRDSHSVDKEPFVANFAVGAGAIIASKLPMPTSTEQRSSKPKKINRNSVQLQYPIPFEQLKMVRRIQAKIFLNPAVHASKATMT